MTYLNNKSKSFISILELQSGVKAQKEETILLYIPSKDRYNNLIQNFEQIIKDITKRLCHIFRGLTIIDADGFWITNANILCIESTKVLQISCSWQTILDTWEDLTKLLIEFGKMTEQNVVKVLVGDYSFEYEFDENNQWCNQSPALLMHR